MYNKRIKIVSAQQKGDNMKAERFEIERLTERTCIMNGAVKGFACNKTVFLLQERVQLSINQFKTWTIKNYERDRLGLINGVLFLLNTSENKEIEIYFPKFERFGEIAYVVFNKEMSFTDVSKIIDHFYVNGFIIYK